MKAQTRVFPINHPMGKHFRRIITITEPLIYGDVKYPLPGVCFNSLSWIYLFFNWRFLCQKYYSHTDYSCITKRKSYFPITVIHLQGEGIIKSARTDDPKEKEAEKCRGQGERAQIDKMVRIKNEFGFGCDITAPRHIAIPSNMATRKRAFPSVTTENIFCYFAPSHLCAFLFILPRISPNFLCGKSTLLSSNHSTDHNDDFPLALVGGAKWGGKVLLRHGCQ